MLSANFFLLAAVLPTCLLWQAAGLGDALLAFLIAAGAALLFTLPAARACFIVSPPRWPRRSGCSPSSPSASASMPLQTGGPLFPRLSDRDPDRVRPLRAAHRHPRAARRGAAFGARRGITMLILALVAVLAGGGRGRDAEKPHPARDARRLDRGLLHGGGQAEHGRRAGRGGDVVSAVSGALLRVRQRAADRAGVLTGAIFRAAVLVYAVLKTVIPRLSVR